MEFSDLLIERHALSRAAADTLVRVGVELQARSRAGGVEIAALVDADAGDVLGALIEGAVEGVDITTHLQLMQSGRRYVQVHTHLSQPTRAFSLDDALLLATYDDLVAMVVGVDAAWYVLSKDPGADPPLPRRLVQAWQVAALELLPVYRGRVGRGELSREEAEAALRDTVWQTVAAGHGLRYDRFSRLRGGSA